VSILHVYLLIVLHDTSAMIVILMANVDDNQVQLILVQIHARISKYSVNNILSFLFTDITLTLLIIDIIPLFIDIHRRNSSAWTCKPIIQRWFENKQRWTSMYTGFRCKTNAEYDNKSCVMKWCVGEKWAVVVNVCREECEGKG
jgi:hypothetical protein